MALALTMTMAAACTTTTKDDDMGQSLQYVGKELTNTRDDIHVEVPQGWASTFEPENSPNELVIARDLDARFSDDFVCLSVNLAPAFPDNLGVQSWQRSVILSPSEQQVRIIESFDLLRPAGPVSFHFMTPKRPERLSDRALRLGDDELLLVCDVGQIGDVGLHRGVGVGAVQIENERQVAPVRRPGHMDVHRVRNALEGDGHV